MIVLGAIALGYGALVLTVWFILQKKRNWDCLNIEQTKNLCFLCIHRHLSRSMQKSGLFREKRVKKQHSKEK